MLVISAAFFLAGRWTVSIVGSALLQETAGAHMVSVSRLSATYSERIARTDADAFYAELVEAARQLGGRLLVVDTDDKVMFDTFDERCGMLLPYAEVVSILSGEVDADYGFHPRGVDPEAWEGCFASALRSDTGRAVGVIVSIISVQETLLQVRSLQESMTTVFLIALLLVLALAALISGLLTRPVRELSAGIERMGQGEYGQPVHVPGRGEMAELAAAFNEMSEKVHTLDESRNQFVSNASHELKTPLATMKILVETMLYQEDMDEETRHEFLGDIDKEIDRLSAVVSDLLTLTRIDSRKMDLRRETMSLADIAQESARRLLPLAESRRQTLTLSLEDPCVMEADAAKLTQVCYNLINNAIKYTPEGGAIRVLLHRSGRDACLEVQDNGVGIAEADLPHVFDRFYRADKARKRDGDAGGTGLGLSIVRQIVRLHAGTVTVRSKPGEGSTFTVLLPMKQEGGRR